MYCINICMKLEALSKTGALKLSPAYIVSSIYSLNMVQTGRTVCSDPIRGMCGGDHNCTTRCVETGPVAFSTSGPRRIPWITRCPIDTWLYSSNKYLHYQVSGHEEFSLINTSLISPIICQNLLKSPQSKELWHKPKTLARRDLDWQV